MRSHAALLTILLLAVAARGSVIAWKSAELIEDRDAYLGLAVGLAEERGYSSPGSTTPTAFRPPLYPMILSLLIGSHPAIWVGIINVVCGVVTVGLTQRIGRQLGLSSAAATIAAALIAIDPLLVRYSSQAMSESLCVCLVTAWLWATLPLQQHSTPLSCLSAGLIFGMAALCRPTMWIAGGCVGLFLAWRWMGRVPDEPHSVGRCNRSATTSPPAPRCNPSRVSQTFHALAGLAGIAVVVLPWIVRNAIVLGRPILTTTHGGYTLLLGNNSVFYSAVAKQPWGTSWDGSRGPTQGEWVTALQSEMHSAGVVGELAQDRWMNQRAWDAIRSDRQGFLAAALLRLAWFWSPVPQPEAQVGWPPMLLWGVGGFYILEWIAALAGLLTVLRRRSTLWWPGLLLVLSFAAVHLCYWSNARMRAPVMPILALLAVHGAATVVPKLGRNQAG